MLISANNSHAAIYPIDFIFMRTELLGRYGKKTKAALGTIGNILTKPIAEARKKRSLERTEEEDRLRKISVDPLNVTPEDIKRHETKCLDRAFWLTPRPINIWDIPVSFIPIAFFREQDRWKKLTLQQRRDETFQAAKQKAIELKLI